MAPQPRRGSARPSQQAALHDNARRPADPRRVAGKPVRGVEAEVSGAAAMPVPGSSRRRRRAREDRRSSARCGRNISRPIAPSSGIISARRGPTQTSTSMFSYFTLRGGIDWMEENIRWCDWAVAEIDRNRRLFARESQSAAAGLARPRPPPPRRALARARRRCAAPRASRVAPPALRRLVSEQARPDN